MIIYIGIGVSGVIVTTLFNIINSGYKGVCLAQTLASLVFTGLLQGCKVHGWGPNVTFACFVLFGFVTFSQVPLAYEWAAELAQREHAAAGASAGLINAGVVLVAIGEITVNFWLTDMSDRLKVHQTITYVAFALALIFYSLAKHPSRQRSNDRESRESHL